MKRILRSFFLLLLVIVWSSNALAVTSPYSYTFKSGGSFTADKQTKTTTVHEIPLTFQKVTN